MKTQLACIPCFARQALDAVMEAVPDEARREHLLRRLLNEIAAADWTVSPPAMAQQLQRIIRRELGDPDPYRAIKQQMNAHAAKLIPIMGARIAHHPNSREAAVRVAIGGNMLDVGAETQINATELATHLESIWTQPLHGEADALFAAAAQARAILFLADNAGEIFFDRLLLERLPREKITVAVRGAPVLNDALRADAEAAGISALVPVIDTGSDAPGVILADTSAEFRRHYDAADLIIAKGQGNYETLANEKKNIYFLFTVKCPLVARHTHAPVGSLMVYNHFPQK